MSGGADADPIQTRSRDRCYLCNRQGKVVYASVRDRLYEVPGEWNVRRCRSPVCRLYWLDPLPLDSEHGKLYGRYFTHGDDAPKRSAQLPRDLARPLGQAILAARYGYSSDQVSSGLYALGKLAGLSPRSRDRVGRHVLWTRGEWRGRVLDVGCGSGDLLSKLNALGWECVGQEPDEFGRRTASDQHNLRVYAEGAEYIAEREAPFDVITMSHVIEHLSDPVAAVRRWSKLLRPDGRMLIVTPNVDSLASRWYRDSWLHLEPPRHFFLFSERTLRQCVENAGLNVEELRTKASAAKQTWKSSRIIRREHKITEARRRGASPAYAGRWGDLFSLAEHYLTPWGLGEEILLTARLV